MRSRSRSSSYESRSRSRSGTTNARGTRSGARRGRRRSRSSSSSPSPSPSRSRRNRKQRDEQHYNRTDDGGPRSRDSRDRRQNNDDAQLTVVVRNLHPETTGAQIEASIAAFWPLSVRVVDSFDRSHKVRVGFVEFSTAEYSRALLAAYPGSAGAGPNAKALMIDGSPVQLEFGREQQQQQPRQQMERGQVQQGFHADWVCEHCNETNFSRRLRCFQCSADRRPSSRVVMADPILDARPPPNAQRYPAPTNYATNKDDSYDCAEGTATLVLYGLSRYTGEDELMTAMRAFAPVKEVKLMRDGSGRTRGVGFVTFFNLDAAAHTLRTSKGMIPVDQAPECRVAFSMGAAAAAAQQKVDEASKKYEPPHRSGSPSRSRRRRSRSRSPRPRSPSPIQARPLKREWPPAFEKDGAAYTFDCGSGYFYEPSSGFYYDPKNKIYYNAHKQEYYYHTPKADPPFTRFEHPSAKAKGGAIQSSVHSMTMSNETAEAQRRAAEVKAAKKAKKAKEVKLADRELKPSAPIVFGLPKTTVTAPTISKVASFIAPTPASFAKPKVAVSHLLAVGTDYSQIAALVVNEKPIVEHDPKTGKWLCLVSRRQFATEEALKKHITKSNLYKDALEKAANEGKVELKT